MIRIESAYFVRGRDDHRKSRRSAVCFELLDDGAPLVRLLVQDHVLQSSLLKQAGDFDLRGAVASVNDKNLVVVGKSGLHGRGRGCALTKIRQILFKPLHRLVLQGERSRFAFAQPFLDLVRRIGSTSHNQRAVVEPSSRTVPVVSWFIGERLFVDSGRDQPLVIAVPLKAGGAMILAPVVESLIAEIVARQVDVIVIDPFVSSHKVAENDNGAMDTVINEWGRVAEPVALGEPYPQAFTADHFGTRVSRTPAASNR
jgi:AAA domain